MKQFMLLTTKALCVSLFLAASALAQSPAQNSPSLADTQKWLADQLQALAGWTDKDISRGIDEAEFKGCALTYRLFQQGSVRSNLKIALRLGDIDAARVRVVFEGDKITSSHDQSKQPHYQCLLPTVDSRKTIKASWWVMDYTIPDELQSETTIPFKDEATAQRFAKAFAHAAMLCATEKEPF